MNNLFNFSIGGIDHYYYRYLYLLINLRFENDNSDSITRKTYFLKNIFLIVNNKFDPCF